MVFTSTGFVPCHRQKTVSYLVAESSSSMCPMSLRHRGCVVDVYHMEISTLRAADHKDSLATCYVNACEGVTLEGSFLQVFVLWWW